MKALLALLPMLLVACQMPIEYTASNGSKTETFKSWGVLGGSESWRTAGGLEMTGNRNKSFGQGAQAVTAVAGGIVAGQTNRAKDASDALTTQQANKQAAALAAQKEANAAAAAAAKATPIITTPPQIVTFPP